MRFRLCLQCGIPIAIPKRRYCRTCRPPDYRDQRVQNGMCRDCGKPRERDDRDCCNYCLERNRRSWFRNVHHHLEKTYVEDVAILPDGTTTQVDPHNPPPPDAILVGRQEGKVGRFPPLHSRKRRILEMAVANGGFITTHQITSLFDRKSRDRVERYCCDLYVDGLLEFDSGAYFLTTKARRTLTPNRTH